MSYLDAAATEPPHPAALTALAGAMAEAWADPDRHYSAAARTRLLLDTARGVVAGQLGCRPDEVAFTASGSEAVRLGLAGLAKARQRVGTHLAVSAVEHSSVLNTADWLTGSATDAVTRVGVDRLGRVAPEAYAAALRPDTAAACLQAANHEVGTVQPVAEVAAACAARGVPLLVDACQVVGRAPVPAGWSVLAASAHKWGGPPGVGVLAIRKGVRWERPGPADQREGGRAPGRPNVPAIVAAAAALRARADEMGEAERLWALVDRIRTQVAASVPDVEVVGDPVRRLPHLVTFSCLYLDGEALVRELDRAGFAVGSGSACSSAELRPSHVLAAMGVLTHGNVRVSLARTTTAADVERFLTVLPDVVARLRAETGV